MDQLLIKIRDLEKEAGCLLKQQQHQQHQQHHHPHQHHQQNHHQQNHYQQHHQQHHQQQHHHQQHKDAANGSVPGDVFSFSHWIQDIRTRAGGWTAGPLVVLSLFDGIGGIWNALSLLGIPFVGYSCEINPSAIQVVQARFPRVRHLGDITALQMGSIPEKVDLIVGGFPCQDLSSMGHRMGLHGLRSRLFFEMLRVINMLKPTWFLAENVASMTWQDRDEISKHLRTIPIEIDSQELTPSRRRRVYWSNVPYPKRIPRLRDHVTTNLQSVLKDGTALDSKIGCIMSANVGRGGNCALDLVMDNSTCSLRYINVIEVEKVMGYPAGYTNIKFKPCDKNGYVVADYAKEFVEVKQVTRSNCTKTLRSSQYESNCTKTLRSSQYEKANLQIQPLQSRHIGIHPQADGVNRNLRWNLLGNTFSVNVIAYLLSPLLERTGRAVLKPIVLPKSIREQDCSAMEPGEVWALYNSHERPNWYALIVSRAGDRFGMLPGKKKKPPIHIEVRFMELVEAYSAEEQDEWDTIRGTGLFRVRDMIDNQNSWVAFSHRIDNYLKFEDYYFIFPAKDEVWAVYDRVAHCRYLVYVMESHVDKSMASQGTPGVESFNARCRLLQRVEPELYRLIDRDIDYTDLSLFTFKAPYLFRNEGTLLKIDLTTRQRAARTDYVKRKRKGLDSDSEEDDGEGEGGEDDGAYADVMGVNGKAGRAQNNDSPPAAGER